MFKNSLADLFDQEDKELAQKGNSVLMFDMHNVVFRTLFTAIFNSPEDNENGFAFWKHIFVNSLLNTINDFKPDKVIMAFDKKPSWRYEVFERYKANRADRRDKAVIDFDKFFPILNKMIIDLKETFTNIYVLEVDKSEADDVIATLVKEEFKTENVIIVSSDKDMNQLIDKDRVRQYDPIKRKMVKCLNPKKELEIKIITGDKSDTIPAIKTRTGVATAEGILKKGLDKYLDLPENKQIKENYIRNRKLIDLDYIPNDISTAIINKYREYEIKEIDSNNLMKFFSKNRLLKIMDSWQNYSETIRHLS